MSIAHSHIGYCASTAGRGIEASSNVGDVTVDETAGSQAPAAQTERKRRDKSRYHHRYLVYIFQAERVIRLLLLGQFQTGNMKRLTRATIVECVLVCVCVFPPT